MWRQAEAAAALLHHLQRQRRLAAPLSWAEFRRLAAAGSWEKARWQAEGGSWERMHWQAAAGGAAVSPTIGITRRNWQAAQILGKFCMFMIWSEDTVSAYR